MRKWRGALIGTAALVLIAAACGSSNDDSAPAKATTTSAPVRAVTTCANRGSAPKRYDSVVVFSFENRTWDAVGQGFGPKMPYLHDLGMKCAWFPEWTEADTKQVSLSQYMGQITGAPEPKVINDCNPSATCHTTANSIFRQARLKGLDAVNYVEGATQPCSAEGNAPKHVPALYLYGDSDPAHCTEQVRPYTDFDPTALPDFALVTPTLCNYGHDCGNDIVDSWARANIQPVLDSADYKAGKVAVFVWYDEDMPVPNLWITPTATSGSHPLAGAGYSATLAAWQSMLGLGCLESSCGAADMRTAANS